MAENQRNTEGEGGVGGPVAAAGIAVLAVACCGAAPLLIALAGGLAAGALLGAGAALLAVLALVAALLVARRARRRRACAVRASTVIEADAAQLRGAGDEAGPSTSADVTRAHGP